LWCEMGDALVLASATICDSFVTEEAFKINRHAGVHRLIGESVKMRAKFPKDVAKAVAEILGELVFIKRNCCLKRCPKAMAQADNLVVQKGFPSWSRGIAQGREHFLSPCLFHQD